MCSPSRQSTTVRRRLHRHGHAHRHAHAACSTAPFRAVHQQPDPAARSRRERSQSFRTTTAGRVPGSTADYGAQYKLGQLYLDLGHTTILAPAGRQHAIDARAVLCWSRQIHQHGPSAFPDMPLPELPMPRAFVTALLSSVHTQPPLPSGNATTEPASPSAALHLVADATRQQLLTLHVLFANEFLPALDLLDRRLITRFRISTAPHGDTIAQPPASAVHRPSEDNCATRALSIETSATKIDAILGQPGSDHHRMSDEAPDGWDTVYYVKSAQQRSTRYSTSYDITTSYQVRLGAWNCSCPAFAFAAFPPSVIFTNTTHPLHSPHLGAHRTSELTPDSTWSFGGCSTGDGMPPICKHLLACVLVEKCAIFSGLADERCIGSAEAAGWAAGWGD